MRVSLTPQISLLLLASLTHWLPRSGSQAVGSEAARRSGTRSLIRLSGNLSQLRPGRLLGSLGSAPPRAPNSIAAEYSIILSSSPPSSLRSEFRDGSPSPPHVLLCCTRKLHTEVHTEVHRHRPMPSQGAVECFAAQYVSLSAVIPSAGTPSKLHR